MIDEGVDCWWNGMGKKWKGGVLFRGGMLWKVAILSHGITMGICLSFAFLVNAWAGDGVGPCQGIQGILRLYW